KLFQLPAELLDRILDFLEDDKKTLASLALVSSICLYLARACQFKEIHFDYSPQSHELLLHMATESLDDDNETNLLPIGVFVRKFTFAPLEDFLSTIHPKLSNAMYIDRFNDSLPFTQLRETIVENLSAAQEHYVNQRKRIFTVIASKMPNLVGLVWKDKVQLDSDFLEAISRCSAEHVKLEKIRPSKHWPMTPPLVPVQWKLFPGYPPTMAMHHPTSVFLNTLFQSCSSTLESLTWWHTASLEDQLAVTLDHSKLTFPRLQRLSLERLYFKPESFSSFMGPSLRHLRLPRRYISLILESLETCKPLAYLQTLEVPDLPLTREGCMPIAKFIKRHNHVQKLHLSEEHEIIVKGDQISSLCIPILATGRFNDLRCLSLSWSGKRLPYYPEEYPYLREYKDEFPEPSLVALGTIGSLEQLSLRFGFRSNWLLDHGKLRRHLKGLSRLKTLALLHDTYYRLELKHLSPTKYYDEIFVIDSDYMDADARPRHDAGEDYGLDLDKTVEYDDVDYGRPGATDQCTWERAHRNRMLVQAEAYAKVLPQLEWMYCGQRPMGLRAYRGEDGVVCKEAIPLSRRRVTCRAFLNKTFG
ncbi:hypothetical protein TRIATDRAFT_174021, partial [Trichoderma atroviride IMI 206040]